MAAPAGEPSSRAARVDAGRRTKMLSEVQEDVDEAPSRLGGCSERVRVISAAPDRAAPARGSVDRLGAATGQPLDASDQSIRLVAFGDEVNVIALDGEM